MWWPWLTEKTSIHLVNASSGQEPYRIFESDALLANQVSRLLHRILEKKNEIDECIAHVFFPL